MRQAQVREHVCRIYICSTCSTCSIAYVYRRSSPTASVAELEQVVYSNTPGASVAEVRLERGS